MQNKLEDFFRGIDRVGRSDVISHPEIHIVDLKNHNNGDIEILANADSRIKSVLLKNESSLEIYYYIFTENALRLETYNPKGKLIDFQKNSHQQCECLLTPNNINMNPACWILLLELKYAADLSAASRKTNNYPQKMIDQIVSTAKYLRRHGIIPEKKQINALVSFPNIIEDFDSSLFLDAVYDDGEQKLSIDDVKVKYQILIRPKNSAIVKNEMRLKS